MKIRTLAVSAAVAFAVATSAANAGTIFVDMGPSAQDFTLYGQGPIAPGIGSFTVGQGTGSFDSVTNTSTFVLSGAITGGSAGYTSGNYSFVTTYTGSDTPEAGPNAPTAQSNPSNTNFFFYDTLDPSTTMTLFLTGTPTGDHTISLVTAGNFDSGTGFSFLDVSSSCLGVSSCGQNNVGLTLGASISGPVDISASFNAVPEPATWAIFLVGFSAMGFMMRGSRRKTAVAMA